MMIELSSTQARALAALVASLRPGWDEAGILTALHDARTRGTPAEVAHAAIRAASVETNRTPAVIALEGPHWSTGTATVTPSTRQPRCTVEGHEHELAHNCRICRADALAAGDEAPALRLSPEQAARNIHGAATARAALREPDPRERAAGEATHREDDPDA